MKPILLFLIAIVGFQTVNAQKTVAPKSIKPILVDKTAMSGIGLRPVKNPREPNRKLFQKNIFRGKDISVYIVSSETATTDHKSYGIEEFLYIANGRARMKPKDGKERFYSAGDFFVAPKGFSGEWETQGGTKFHYELSVITTGRSEKDAFGKTKLPYAIDKAKLSGIGLKKIETLDGKEFYRDELFKGIELSIHLEAEEGRTRKIKKTARDQLIYIIAGTVEIGGDGMVAQTFHTGDFLILPRGFAGSWESKGHHLFRTLRVTKSR